MTLSPDAFTVVGSAVFTNVNAGAGAAVTTASSGGDVTSEPLGGVPVAVAVFVTFPALMSAWVTAYVAVHVVLAPGANVVTGHVTADMVPAPDVPVDEAMRGWWRHISDPSLWPNERLFYELYGQAIQGRAHTRAWASP